MDKWLADMERLTQSKEELEVKWGDATTKSSVDDWLRMDKPPEFDSLLRMKDGKPDLEVGGRPGRRNWQEDYAFVISPYRKITQEVIDNGRERYNAARNAALRTIRSLDIVIPGLHLTWKNNTFGMYDDRRNIIDIGLGKIAVHTQSVQEAHNFAGRLIKHEFGHAIWQRMDMNVRREWMEAVRRAGPMSDYDRKWRDDAKREGIVVGKYMFGKTAVVRSSGELGWFDAANESHSITLEAIGADEDVYYNPQKNFDLDDDSKQIAKYRKNRMVLTRVYRRIFGHLGVAENFARIT